jgi:hypothetical protein
METFVRTTEWIEKKPRPKWPRRGNSPERAEMLKARRRGQRAHAGNPMRGYPASINRRTDKPHENNRERRRF